MSASHKRGAEGAEDLPPVKRAATESVAEEKNDGDVFKLQRDALARTLKVKNEEINGLRERLETEVKRRSTLEEQVQSVELAWKQVSSDVAASLARLDAAVPAPAAPSAFGLLAALRDQASLSPLLKGHTETVVSMVTRLAALLEKGTAATVTVDADAQNRVESENRQLRSQVAALETAASAFAQQRKDLETQVGNSEVELDMRARKIVRLEESLANAAKLSAAASATVAAAATVSPQPTPVAPSASAPNGGDARFEERLEDLNRIAEKRLNELNAARDERSALLRELERARRDVRDPPESLIVSSLPFRRLQQHCEYMRAEMEQLRASSAAATAAMQDLAAQRRAYAEEVVATERKHAATLEADLQTIQNDATRLRNERDTLRTQHDQLQGKVSGLETVLTETQRLLETMTAENTHLRGEIKRNASGSAAPTDPAAMTNEQMLQGELDELSKAFEANMAQSSRLLKLVREKEDAAARAHSEKVKATQTAMTFVKEREAASRKSSALQKQNVALLEATKRLEASERLHQQELSTQEKLVASLNASLEQHRRKTAEAMQMHSDAHMAAEKNHELVAELQATAAERANAVERDLFEARRAQEELLSAKKRLNQLEKLESTMAAGADAGLKEELASYQQLLRCSSCLNRHKAVVITQCYHCFCKECIDRRVETRQRKCPTCGEKFGVNDVHALYL